MLCQECHKNSASTRYAEVVDGKVTDLHLCKECLAHRNRDTPPGFELSEPLPFVKKNSSSALAQAAVSTESCDTCGTELQTIVASGRMGCTDCYEAFPVQLESLLEGIHVAINHRGKVPQLDDARARVRAELQSKRALLKTALTTENYEDAASLRDEIRSLETGLDASEAGAD